MTPPTAPHKTVKAATVPVHLLERRRRYSAEFNIPTILTILSMGAVTVYTITQYIVAKEKTETSVLNRLDAVEKMKMDKTAAEAADLAIHNETVAQLLQINSQLDLIRRGARK